MGAGRELVVGIGTLMMNLEAKQIVPYHPFVCVYVYFCPINEDGTKVSLFIRTFHDLAQNEVAAVPAGCNAASG